MKQKIERSRFRACMAALALVAAWMPGVSRAAPYTIARWTVDGGGARGLQAGSYSLNGTIGQPDAGRLIRLNDDVNGGFWQWADPALVAVGDPPPEDPDSPPPVTLTIREVRVHPPFPNPLLDRTRISFELPDSRDVDVRIFGVHGERIRTLATGMRSAGRHWVEWDVRDAAGHRVGPGLYFARVCLGAFEKTQKLVVTR
jgi:hypothetical protein